MKPKGLFLTNYKLQKQRTTRLSHIEELDQFHVPYAQGY